MKSIKQLLTTCILLIAGSLCKAQGLAATPAKLFFSGEPGSTMIQRVTLFNPGSSPITVRAFFKDWERDSLGTKVYFDQGKLESSNAGWLSLDQEIIELQAGEKKDITVTMNIPGKQNVQTAVKNSMLFFSQINEQKRSADQKKKQSTQLNISLEVGVHIYFTPPGLSKKNVDITGFRYQPEGKKRLALVLDNTGEVVADGMLQFELTDISSGKDVKLPARTISILPGAKQTIYIDVPDGFAGRKVLAVAMLDLGADNELKIAEKNFEVLD